MPTWKKGQSGNPKGRPPILLPELQSALDRNKNAVKELALTLLGMSVDDFEMRANTAKISVTERALIQCIERATSDGDIFRLRAVLEIPFGKIPEDRPEFEISEEEKLLIQEYRRRIKEGIGSDGSAS